MRSPAGQGGAPEDAHANASTWEDTFEAEAQQQGERQRPPGHAAFSPRFKRQVRRLHDAGPRVLAETLLDIDEGRATVRELLLWIEGGGGDVANALGADDFVPSLVAVPDSAMGAGDE